MLAKVESTLEVERISACSTKKQTLGPHVKFDRDQFRNRLAITCMTLLVRVSFYQGWQQATSIN
jgi:hypothetical protein